MKHLYFLRGKKMGKGRQRSDYEQGLPGNATAGGRDGSMAPQNQTLNNLIDPISSIFG